MEEKERVLKYKDYPEGSVGKQVYDSINLPFDEYLKKYYTNPDISTFELWQKKYIEAAFDIKRHNEMIKNFGYTDIKYYDFDKQYDFYENLKKDNRLDESIRKFIGFMAGTGFFLKNNLTVEAWFSIKNWSNLNIEIEDGRTINEILNFSNGKNYLKTILPQLDYWKR